MLELLANDPELQTYVEPMLRMRRSIRAELEMLAAMRLDIVRSDPVCRRLMTIPGIGPINALAFVTAIDNPHNFTKSQSVGAFLGQISSQYASGDLDRHGSAPKGDDAMVREYLFEAV